MIYIFKDSLDRLTFTNEKSAREMLDQKTGGRIKYEYLGASDDKEYNKKRQDAINEANKKFVPVDFLDDATILEKRKFIDEKIAELEKDLLKKADKSILPREFKVFKLNLNGGDSVEEEKNPIFKGMIK